MILFKYNYKLFDLNDILKIKKNYKIKKLNILDFGCSTGVWDEKKLQKNLIDVYLYDKNKELLPILKKKYKNKNIFISFDKKKIFKKKINLIIFSSVLQYMSNIEVDKVFLEIIRKYRNKKIFIIINDLPIYPRYIEFFLLPLINLRVFFYSLTLIFNRRYLKINYFHHRIYNRSIFKKNFHIKELGYSKDMKFLRKRLLLSFK